MENYQGLGVYPAPAKRRNTTLIVAIIAAVLVVGAVAALLLVRVTSETPGQALPVANAGPTTTTKPKDPLQPKTTGAPQVPGWKVMPISNGKELNTDKAYDVPPQGWAPAAGGLVTFGDHSELSLIAPAIYQHGYCAEDRNSWRAMAGMLIMPNKGDIQVGAAAAAQVVSNTVFTNNDRVQPEIELSSPQEVTVLRDKKGVLLTAKLTIPLTAKDKCAAKSVAVVVMMLEPNKVDDSDSVTMLAMGDQDVPDSATEKDLRQIVTSMHSIT